MAWSVSISEKLKRFFEIEKLTGWNTYPIKIFDKKGNEVEGYYGLSIIGKCGPVDFTQCEIFEKKLVPEGPLCKIYKSLPIGLDKWDQSDFFLSENAGSIIITRKAADLLQINKFTNIQMENVAKT